MNANLDTVYMALQAERDTLETRAYRRAIAAEATSSHVAIPSARRLIGELFVTIGQRLQGNTYSAPADRSIAHVLGEAGPTIG